MGAHAGRIAGSDPTVCGAGVMQRLSGVIVASDIACNHRYAATQVRDGGWSVVFTDSGNADVFM